MLREARAWAQGRNLEGAGADVIEECCSGARALAVVLSMLSYTAQDHQPTVSRPLLYQSVAKKMPHRHAPDQADGENTQFWFPLKVCQADN